MTSSSASRAPTGKRGGIRFPRLPWVAGLRSDGGARFWVTLGLVCALAYLMTGRAVTEYGDLAEGTVSRERIVAPFTFWVTKGRLEVSREQEEARRHVGPVLVFDPVTGPGQIAGLDSLFRAVILSRTLSADSSRISAFQREAPNRAISGPALRVLLGVDRLRGLGSLSGEEIQLMRALGEGILSEIYASGVFGGRSAAEWERATLVRAGVETPVLSGEIQRLSVVVGTTLPDLIQKRWPGIPQPVVRTFYEVLQAFVAPNLFFDEAETDRRRETAARSVSENRYVVLENQKIIDANERVTREHVEMLRSLAQEKFRRRYEDPYGPYLQLLSALLLSGLFVALLWLYLSVFRPALYRNGSTLVLLGILLLLPVGIASYIEGSSGLSPLYVPVALSATLAALLFDAELGVVVAIVAALLSGVTLHSLHAGVTGVVCGMAGSFSVRDVRHRHHFNRSILYLTFSYVAVVIALKGFLYSFSTSADLFRQVGQDLVPGLVMGILTPVLTLGLSPIFENLFGIVTPITLLELSDLNRPLLRNLATRAPGTYTHSVIVANLSEAAAESIGANALLARAGCYYHDIGKIVRPQYFAENQTAGNPHDELQPQMSALVLISHVREGMRIAEEEGLPRILIDLIPQHHGTGEISYFKHRAIERGMRDYHEEAFHYPGPKPQTKEAGIIMLADCVEPAVRSLKDRSQSRIKGTVRTIVESKFTSGDLDECDLTLRDLHRIEQAFMPVLMGALHSRVEYPWQRGRERSRG